MDIKQLLESEKDNWTQIRLYKEGLFFRAYEHSAYALSQAKTLKPTRKESKALGVSYVSVGFPITSLDKFMEGLATLSAAEDRLVLGIKEPITPEAYEEWKESVPVSTPQTDKEKHIGKINGKGVIEELEIFDLSIHTPIECMVFLANIKSRMSKES